MSKKAVVVLSGGLDSTTCMGYAKQMGYELVPLTFHYGQRHWRELVAAKAVAEHYGVPYREINLSFMSQIGGSSLTDMSRPVKVDGAVDSTEIPDTYVPGRNLIFLAIAASFAEANGCEAIFTGVNALDYSGYPDCRPEFIEAVQEVLRIGTKVGQNAFGGIAIETPLVNKNKKEIIEMGLALGVPYHLTTSCYNGGKVACGKCDSCVLRLQGFARAGASDPIPYAEGVV